MFCVQRLYDDHEGVHHAKFRSTDAISDKLTPPLTLSLTLSLSSVSIAGRLPPGDHDHDMSWAPYTLQHYLCWKPHESQRMGNARARANYDCLGGGRLCYHRGSGAGLLIGQRVKGVPWSRKSFCIEHRTTATRFPHGLHLYGKYIFSLYRYNSAAFAWKRGLHQGNFKYFSQKQDRRKEPNYCDSPIVRQPVSPLKI